MTTTERKLASIQRIVSIDPIPGADAIERVRVLGWDLVSRKGEFAVGDLCTYFEVDSFLPERPEFEFLRSSSFRTMGDLQGFRLRTISLRKQVSQGLAIPYKGSHPVGTDVTEELGIVKWDPPIPAQLAGLVKGNFPGFLTKTDEVRIQSEPELINAMKDKAYYISTKLDGCSATYFLRDGEFGVCSRNLELKETEGNSFWDLARRKGLKDILEKAREDHGDLCIQGELCGPGIQKNPLKLKEVALYIFNIYPVGGTKRSRFSVNAMEAFVKKHGLSTVPIEEIGFEFLYSSVDELLNRAEGQYESGKTKEGIVVRSISGNRLSFKVINNKFLLKEKD